MPIDISAGVGAYKNYFDAGGTTTTTSTDPTQTKGSFWDGLTKTINTVGNMFNKSDGSPLFDLSKIVKMPDVNVGPTPETKKTLNIVLIAGGALVLIAVLFGGKKRRR
jgi:LPXTG-motif cell wall-anchored protein